jgi:hypothetical protein
MEYTGRMMRALVFTSISMALFLPLFSFAHTSGASHEEIVGEYKVDIGYDPVIPQGGDRLVFDFGTFTRADMPEDFDYVWVRIEDATRTVLAMGITRAEFGPTSLLYALPDDMEGEITVHARYQKSEKVLAEVKFPIAVERSLESKKEDQRLLIVGALIFLLGAAVSFIGVRYFYAKKR